jgi:hypothetical protein
MTGFIYVLRTNLTIDGQEVVKIGMTTKTVTKRARQVRTGSPVGMEVAYSLSVENPRAFEKELHSRYSGHRVQAGGGREFFKVSASEAIREIERRAADISREKARQAFASELRTFEQQRGIATIRKRIGALCLASALLLMIAVSWFVFRHVGSGWGILSIFPGLILWMLLAVKLAERLEHRFVHVPYWEELSAKRAQLKLKYPLA